MYLSKKEAVELHRELWSRIAERQKQVNYFVEKEEIIDEMIEEKGIERPLSNCFCCEYVAQNHEDKCKYCPILFSENPEFCYIDDSEYQKWGNADTVEERAMWAEEIANLLERK